MIGMGVVLLVLGVIALGLGLAAASVNPNTPPIGQLADPERERGQSVEAARRAALRALGWPLSIAGGGFAIAGVVDLVLFDIEGFEPVVYAGTILGIVGVIAAGVLAARAARRTLGE